MTEGVGFSLDSYAKLRPTLWHFTDRHNLLLIRESRTLRPASQLHPGAIATVPRRGSWAPRAGAVLRDQDLLHQRCVTLTGNWRFEDLLRDLAQRVLFWSGWHDRPVRAGRRAYQRYAGTDIILRVPFAALRDQNPQFSRCNYGATRMQSGRPVERGPQTFVHARDCPFAPSHVVEVTFVRGIRLPPTTEVSQSPGGPWLTL